MSVADDRPPSVCIAQLVDVTVHGITTAQAYALAELCKRIAFSDCRAMAVSDSEAYTMIEATDRVRGALALVGVCVR